MSEVRNGESGEAVITGGEGKRGKLRTKNFSETYEIEDVQDLEEIVRRMSDKMDAVVVDKAAVQFKMKLEVADDGGEGGKVRTKNFAETYEIGDTQDLEEIAKHITDKMNNVTVDKAAVVFKMKLEVPAV